MEIIYISGEREYLSEDTLPYMMRNRKQNVSVIMPMYGELQLRYYDRLEFKGNIEIDNLSVGIFHMVHNRLSFYLLENTHFFGAGRYYNADGELDRFIFFSKASAKAVEMLALKGIIHTKGWRTAAVPCFLKEKRTILFELENLEEQFPITKADFERHNIKQPIYGGSLLAVGIEQSDELLVGEKNLSLYALSPNSPFKLDSLLRLYRHKIHYISKYINTKKYNPLSDSSLEVNFGVRTLFKRKANEEALVISVDKEIVGAVRVDRASDDYMKMLACADFAHTSHPMEAMAYGCIPLLKYSPCLPDCVNAGNSIIYSNLPPIEEVFRDNERVVELRRMCLKSVRGEREYLADFIKLYENIRGKHRF